MPGPGGRLRSCYFTNEHGPISSGTDALGNHVTDMVGTSKPMATDDEHE
jgi:hypothetical protein